MWPPWQLACAPDVAALPKPLVDFSNHLRSLAFQSTPDYAYLESCLDCQAGAGSGRHVYEFQPARAAAAAAAAAGHAPGSPGEDRGAVPLLDAAYGRVGKPDASMRQTQLQAAGYDERRRGRGAAGDGEAGAPGAMDVDSRNEWRLQPEGRSVLKELLRLDEAQAMAVIAAALEAVALSRGDAAAAAAGGGDAESWLMDVAAHAHGLAERGNKRAHLSLSR